MKFLGEIFFFVFLEKKKRTSYSSLSLSCLFWEKVDRKCFSDFNENGFGHDPR